MATWVVESDGIVVIRRDSGQFARFGYPEAALWDFICRNVPESRMLPMLSALMTCRADETLRWSRDALAEWVDAGWLSGRGPGG